MNKLKRIPIYIVALTAFCQHSAVFAGDDTFVEVDASIGLDDNVTRAANDADIEYDTFATLTANLGHEALRLENGQIVLNADVQANHFFEFTGLSSVSAAAGATYTFGVGADFGAPWFALNANYRITEFDSELRDSDFASINLTMGKRIDDRTDMKIGVGHQSRESDARVFDTDNNFVFVNVDLTLEPKNTIYVTYKYQTGDTFSTADPANISLSVNNAAGLANEADDVFTGKRSYRLDATTHLITLGYNLARNLDSAYDVSVRVLKSTADAGLEYEDLFIRLSYFQRFGVEL
jgi:hypothetical protein